MDEVTALLEALAKQIGAEGELLRSPVRAWVLSGVERIGLPDGKRVIFKYAREPFTRENEALLIAAQGGIPVPRLIATESKDGILGMIMEDLGEPSREPDLTDGAVAAVATHRAETGDSLPILDGKALTALPSNSLDSLEELRARGRWLETGDLDSFLAALADVAERRSQGFDIPPFGLCHSEFHPTSLHLSDDGWRLLDWARAFTGPGLLDLASWQGTTGPADLLSLRQLIAGYIEAGGQVDAATPRGGLPAEVWALGWHRLWIVAWYLEQATTWINDPSVDRHVEKVVRRHLKEANTCLASTLSK